MVSAGSHSMAQQNQEIVPYNSANLPMRRKRGRPRKYDYPGYTPRRRTQLPYPRAIPTQADPLANPSHGPGGQLVQELSNPASGTDPTSYLSSSPHGIMGHAVANENASSGHRHQGTGEQAAGNPTASSSHGHFVGHTGNATAAFSHVPHVLAGHAATDPTANAGLRPNDLLGKAVSGILDGTFDSGYLLTVRVGSSGPVFKGLVFDPRISVPLSPENDVAPLLPMLRRNDVPGPTVGAPGPAPVPMSVRLVPDKVTVAQPLQIREPDASPHVHHVPETSRVSTPFSTKRKARNDDEYATPDTRLSLRSELRAKILQALHTKAVTDANTRSASAASRQKLIPAIVPSGSAPTDGTTDAAVESSGGDQTKEMIFESSKGDQTNVTIVEDSRRDQTRETIVESSRGDKTKGAIVESSRENQTKGTIVESSRENQTKGTIVESSRGDQTKEMIVEFSQGDQIKEMIVESSESDQTKEMIVKSSGADQTKGTIVVCSGGDQAKMAMEAPKGCEASNKAKGSSGQTEQFPAKTSDSNRSPDQEDQPNTQISGSKGTSQLSDQTEHPTTQAPHLHGTEGSSGVMQECSIQTEGPSGRTNQASTELSDFNETKEFPGLTEQPGTEFSAFDGTKPSIELSAFDGTKFSSGDKQENIQSSEKALPTEEHKRGPGEDESSYHRASQSSQIKVEGLEAEQIASQSSPIKVEAEL